MFCISHAEMIRTFVAESGWGDQMQIEVLRSSSCTSAGDVMRELDQVA